MPPTSEAVASSPVASALAIAGTFFVTAQFLSRQAVDLYDGPLMTISFSRSAYANAVISSYEIKNIAEQNGQPDLTNLEFDLDDLLTDLEVSF